MGSETFQSARAEGTRIGSVVLGPAIGQGGEGIVYLAEHDQHGQVVVKEYWPSQISSRSPDGSVVSSTAHWQDAFRQGKERFRQLGKRLIRLHQHQNIVLFHELIEADKTCYLVMQYIAGPTLQDELAAGKFADPHAINRLADQLSSAIVHLHEEEIWHRDISPDNVLISQKNGRALLIDFNAAKDLVLDVTQSVHMLTKSGFSPIEQYSASMDQMAPTADIYSASAVLYFAISGQRPVDATRRAMGEAMPKLSDIAVGKAPPAMLAAIDCGLNVKAADRPQTAEAWRCAMGFDVRDEPMVPKQPPRPPVNVPRWAWIAVPLVFVALLGLWLLPRPSGPVIGPTPTPTAATEEDRAFAAEVNGKPSVRDGVWLLPSAVEPDANSNLKPPNDQVRADDYAPVAIKWTNSAGEPVKDLPESAILSAFPLWKSDTATLAYGTTAKLYVDTAKLQKADAEKDDPLFAKIDATGAKYLIAEVTVAMCVPLDAVPTEKTKLRVPCMAGDWSVKVAGDPMVATFSWRPANNSFMTMPNGQSGTDVSQTGDAVGDDGEVINDSTAAALAAAVPDPVGCTVRIGNDVNIDCGGGHFVVQWADKNTLVGTARGADDTRKVTFTHQ